MRANEHRPWKTVKERSGSIEGTGGDEHSSHALAKTPFIQIQAEGKLLHVNVPTHNLNESVAGIKIKKLKI